MWWKSWIVAIEIIWPISLKVNVLVHFLKEIPLAATWNFRLAVVFLLVIKISYSCLFPSLAFMVSKQIFAVILTLQFWRQGEFSFLTYFNIFLSLVFSNWIMLGCGENFSLWLFFLEFTEVLECGVCSSNMGKFSTIIASNMFPVSPPLPQGLQLLTFDYLILS